MGALALWGPAGAQKTVSLRQLFFALLALGVSSVLVSWLVLGSQAVSQKSPLQLAVVGGLDCQLSFSNATPTEHWIFRQGCPLPPDWTFLVSMLGPSGDVQARHLSESIANATLPPSAKLVIKSRNLFGNAVAVRVQIRHPFQSLQLYLSSIDRTRATALDNVEIKALPSGEGVLMTAVLGTLEESFWGGLEIKNGGKIEVPLAALGALYLVVRSPAELLSQQVKQIKQNRLLANVTSSPSLLVGVLSVATHQQLRTRVVPQFARLGHCAKTLVFVGNSTSQEAVTTRAEEYGGLPLVRLEVSDGYPPRLKDLAMWGYIYEHHVEEFDWFMHLDDDAYIDFGRLGEFLRGFELSGRATEPLYFGGPTTGALFDPKGRPLDVPRGKHGERLPYCVGGPAYVINRPALLKMGPRVQQCAVEWSSWHSDTEVGRCVFKHAGVACNPKPFSEVYLKSLFKSAWQNGKQVLLPTQLTEPLSKAIALHPIKPRGPRYIANHMEDVDKQMRTFAADRRYLAWEGLHLAALQGGYKAAQSALMCALREARILRRIFVMPAALYDGVGAHISTHRLFDVQEAQAQAEIILDDSPEWKLALSRDSTYYIGSEDSLDAFERKKLPVWIRGLAAVASNAEEIAMEIEKTYGLLCKNNIGPYGSSTGITLRDKNNVVLLSRSHHLSELYRKFKETAGYYDAVQIVPQSGVDSFSTLGNISDSLRGLLPSIENRIEKGRTVFLTLKGLASSLEDAIAVFGTTYRILSMRDILPPLETSPLIFEALQDLIYSKAFTRVRVQLGSQISSNFPELTKQNEEQPQTGIANLEPPLKPVQTTRCYSNPLMMTQLWMTENGYGWLFRQDLPKDLRECPAEEALVTPEQFLNELHVFILTLPGQTRWEGLAKICESHGLRTHPWIAVNGSEAFQPETPLPGKKVKPLTPGEKGVLRSMQSILQHAEETQVPAVLILEDDALLSKRFGVAFKELLSSTKRCSTFLRGRGRGGVLLLGATEWQPDDWNWIYDELDNKVFDASEAQCYNINLHTYGAFATIYHRDTYRTIINWVDKQFAVGGEPYDHVYKHLAANGTIVRAAYPYLAVADVGHVSSVVANRITDVVERSVRHEWNLSLYHEPDVK